MDTFASLTALFLAGVLYLRSAASMELWIEPSGPVLEDSTITINCRVTGKHPLDVVRLVRVVDDVAYELTTNELLSETFRDTGRYRIVEYDAAQRFVRLQISHIDGADGGNIGCKLMSNEPSNDDMFTDLIVNVAPRRVDWLYQVGDGDVRAASDGDQLRLRQTVPTTLTCRASVVRSDFQPDVVVTLGDRDITARTSVNATRRRPTTTAAGDGFASVPDWTVERQVRWDAAVAGEFHDKNLTCFAVMKHFAPLTSSVLLAVVYKPELSCEAEWVGQLGQTDYEILCTGRMNPEPLQVVWQWNDGETEIHNDVINNDHLAEQYRTSRTSVGSGHFEFRLFIAEVKPHDFHEYKLTVVNEVDSATAEFTLVEVFTTTERRPSTSRRPSNDRPAAPVHQPSNTAALCCHLANVFVNVLLGLGVLVTTIWQLRL